MDVFNIVVGVFTIIGSVASILSLIILRDISIQQKSNGDNAVNLMQSNRGRNNRNINIKK